MSFENDVMETLKRCVLIITNLYSLKKIAFRLTPHTCIISDSEYQTCMHPSSTLLVAGEQKKCVKTYVKKVVKVPPIDLKVQISHCITKY